MRAAAASERPVSISAHHSPRYGYLITCIHLHCGKEEKATKQNENGKPLQCLLLRGENLKLRQINKL